MRCLCTGRTDIKCDDKHCDIAGPGAPGDPNNCRICWIRLGKPPLKGPPLPRKAFNFAGAVIYHFLVGNPQSTEEMIQKRISLCEVCDYFNPIDLTCKHIRCGCDLALKVSWADSSCPIGKW